MTALPLGVHASRDPGATEALGAACAVHLVLGDVVFLRGELGTGKTTFVRGACRALGIEGPVTSPTFTLGRLYVIKRGGRRLRRPDRAPAGRRRLRRPDRAPADLRVAHLDLHRLADFAGEDPGLLADYLNPSTISFVEWPDVAVAALGEPRLRVELAHAGGDERRIEIA